MRGRIRIGAQGWNYDAWVGPFYPTGTRPVDYLSVYSRAFDTVEVDTTFPAVPRPEHLAWGILDGNAIEAGAAIYQRLEAGAV